VRRLLEGSSIHKTLCYIEWTILSFHAIHAVAIIPFHGNWAPSSLIIIPFLLIWLALSFVFPTNSPYWQKQLYIFVEIGLIFILGSIGWTMAILLYFFLAKACFLLSRRDAIITVILVGMLWQIIVFWIVNRTSEYALAHVAEILDPNRRMLILMFDSVVVSVTASTFAVLISLMMMKERRSNQRAERLAKEVKVMGAMLERERIARDIHDTLGNTLTTLSIQLEVAQQIGVSNIHQTLQRMEIAKQLADRCLEDVREVVQTMRDADFDLTQALTASIDRMPQTQSIDRSIGKSIQTQVQLNLPLLPLQTSYQLYCIVQEGVTNIQKHANATQVKLRGCTVADYLQIELTDNGRGFNLDRPSTGFGLQGMQERVELINGTLEIQTASRQGTQLLVQVPLRSSEPVMAIDAEVSQ
jgi:signal transduction histidine kinase